MTMIGEPTGHQGTFTTADDEASLATARASQSEGAPPDTLEVRSDALAILQDSVAPVRRAILVAGTVGIAALVVVLVTMSWLRRNPNVNAI